MSNELIYMASSKAVLEREILSVLCICTERSSGRSIMPVLNELARLGRFDSEMNRKVLDDKAQRC